MPLPIAAGFFAWLVGLVGSAATAAFTWFASHTAYRMALHYARAVAFIIVAGALFLALSVSMKAAILAARVVMPDSLGQATYFLPGNINTVFALFVTLRVSVFLYNWTLRNIKIVTQTVY